MPVLEVGGGRKRRRCADHGSHGCRRISQDGAFGELGGVSYSWVAVASVCGALVGRAVRVQALCKPGVGGGAGEARDF